MIDDLNTAWNHVMTVTREQVTQSLNDRDAAMLYEAMLNDLRHDHAIDAEHTLLGMRRAPASKDRHHAIEGGLLTHLLEMWALWFGCKNIILSSLTPSVLPKTLTDSMVWRAILHHDLNKIWRYQLISNNPWKVEYSTRDRPGGLLGNANKSLWLLQSYGIRLDLPLYNALLCSEGGYSEVRPSAETVLAKIVHILDEMSANVVDRLMYGRFWDSKCGGINDEK